MEDISEQMALPLPEIKTLLTKLVPMDLSHWNIDTYYEAMGLDFEEQPQENGDL
tara:strand:- start:78 stop:239 length:162 start_codon:yes stop_codon:yes gene_type:complete